MTSNPQMTEPQRIALEVIEAGNVTHNALARQVRPDTIERVLRKGWAKPDPSMPDHIHVRNLVLTDAGRRVLSDAEK